ncbi:sulfotransferase family 2 domain-containing protein [Vibrio breoganii]
MKKIIKATSKKLPMGVSLWMHKIHHVYGKNDYPYRKYCHKFEAIFVHIPKCAGTSVLSMLMGDTLFRDHLTYMEFKQANPYLYERYFKFCFVRNPYERLVSAYTYLSAGGNGKDDLYFKELFREKYPSFEDFVLYFLDSSVIHEHKLFKPQYLYVCNIKKELMVDYVGKLENIDKDIIVIKKRLGISTDLIKANTSPKQDSSNYYTNKKVSDKVFELYKHDFSVFEYEKLLR